MLFSPLLFFVWQCQVPKKRPNTIFIFGMTSIVFWLAAIIGGALHDRMGGVMRLRLDRRLVNLFTLAQRTKTLTNDIDGRTWVVGRGFESHVHHEIAF